MCGRSGWTYVKDWTRNVTDRPSLDVASPMKRNVGGGDEQVLVRPHPAPSAGSTTRYSQARRASRRCIAATVGHTDTGPAESMSASARRRPRGTRRPGDPCPGFLLPSVGGATATIRTRVLAAFPGGVGESLTKGE
jgi:hypothetical protein